MLVNRRRNPIDSTVAAVTITDEQHTVAEFDELPGVYGFILEERPVAGTVSVRQDNTAETPFTIVLTSPLAGQVFVDFNENRGYCIFNAADNGKAIIVTYDGSGANNSVENIRAIADEQIDAQRGAASGLAEFNASRQLKLPNTAGTQTSLLTNANAAARTYTLPDKSGTVAMLDDVTAPDLGPIIDDATVATSISDTDKFAAARDASENLISVAWSLIKSSIFGAINGLTSKSTPVGADVIPIGDSEAGYIAKKATLANLLKVERNIVRTISNTGLSTSASMPINGMTDTDGILLLSATITPTHATSRIYIECSFNISDMQPGTTNTVAAVFRTGLSTPLNARMVQTEYNPGAALVRNTIITIDAVDAPNTTAPVTYTVRIGTNPASSIDILGNEYRQILTLREEAA